jgi:hypothetical protein
MRRIRDEASRLRAGSYREVRYEDLEDAACEVLRGVAEWLGLPESDGWPETAAEMVRRPGRVVEEASGWLRRLAPDDLLYVNANGRQPELELAPDADAVSVDRFLRAGLGCARAGDVEAAARTGLSLLATERAHADRSLAKAAVDLLMPHLVREREDEAAQRWTEWAENVTVSSTARPAYKAAPRTHE